MKDTRWIFCFVIFSLLYCQTFCQNDDLQKCLEKDSISCVQMQIFRNAKELMNQESIDLVSGMSLVLEANNQSVAGEERFLKGQLDLLELEEQIENATDVLARQEAIENFLVRRARDVVVERTIRWDVGQTIRNIINSIPLAIKAKFTNYVTEARGKGKKILKILVPLLIGLKLKMAGMSALTYLGIAVLAKKALLASLISLVISAYIGLKKLLTTKQPVYEEPYYPQPTWPTPHFAYVGDVPDVAAAQKLAYSSYR